MQQPILIVVGTRPEAIKLLPVYFACKQAQLPVVLCSTSQHDTLVKSVFELFGVVPDYDGEIMKRDQDLFHITQAVLGVMRDILAKVQPSLVLVQGDTTTAMAAALAAFYARVPVGHVEAGLRTHDLQSPFPEEMNRRFISLIAAYHFAPTSAAVANVLLQGGHRNTVFCTGNTVVDALRLIQAKITDGSATVSAHIRDRVSYARAQGYRIALCTIHRRESFSGGILTALDALVQSLERHSNLYILLPAHPNPLVRKAIEASGIGRHSRVYLCDAVKYHDLVYMLSAVDWVITDSGGIQEEAASLGKQTLVLRDHTERMESVWAGITHLVGTNADKIKAGIDAMMSAKEIPHKGASDVYGDGRAAERIVGIVRQQFTQKQGVSHSRI